MRPHFQVLAGAAGGGGGGGAPTDASYVVGAAHAGLSAELVLGADVVMRGTLAARPAASLAGRLYFVTDAGAQRLQRDTGAAWEDIAGLPAAPDQSVQYNEAGSFGSLDNVLHDGGGRLEHVEYATFRRIVAPGAAAADKLRLFGLRSAGEMFPAIVDPSARVRALQTVVGHVAGGYIAPAQGGNNPVGYGITGLFAPTGTVSTPALASTNLQTQANRSQWQSAAAAGSSAGTRLARTCCWRGNAAGFGGFYFCFVLSQSLNVNGSRAFVGLSAQAALVVTDADTVNNTIGMCYRAADVPGNWQFVRRNGAAATVVDLGANAPRDTTTVYQLEMWCAPNGSDITVRITNLTTGVVVLDDVTYSTNLPVNTAFLLPHFACNNGAVASAVNIQLLRCFMEIPV